MGPKSQGLSQLGWTPLWTGRGICAGALRQWICLLSSCGPRVPWGRRSVGIRNAWSLGLAYPSYR